MTATKAELLKANEELHDVVARYEAQLKAVAVERERNQQHNTIDAEALALSRCLKALDAIAPSNPSYGGDTAKRAAVKRVIDHLAAKYLGGTQ